MKLNDIRRALTDTLGSADEAGAVIGYVYGIDKTELYLRLFDDFDYSETIDEITKRRTSGEPLEYIIGKTVFCGIDFSVSPCCLIPQADTEVVVQAALDNIGGGRFLDLCTGSGCIAVALAKLGGGSGVAVDISREALDIAEKNAADNGVSDKIKFVCDDIFSSDASFADGKFDVVVSNPPYINTSVIDSLSPEVRHEPRIALDGGDDGLNFYRRIIPLAPSLLNENGTLVLEIGYDQAMSVGALLSEHGFEYTILRDYGGNERCAVAKIKNNTSEGK